MIKEITARELNIDGFINEKIKEIKEIVGDENGDQRPLGRS